MSTLTPFFFKSNQTKQWLIDCWLFNTQQKICHTYSGWEYLKGIQKWGRNRTYRNEGGTEHTEMREEHNIQKWGRNRTYRNEGGTKHTEMSEEQNIQKWGRNRTYRNEGGTELPGQILTATENCLTQSSYWLAQIVSIYQKL
jgi:hypothetical protein